MNATAHSNFQLFAQGFVRKYWEAVKSGVFTMPPNEPVKETVDELVSQVSHETEFKPSLGHEGPLYVLRMTNTHGDWWLFSFRHRQQSWELVEASAKSHNETPHDLLGPAYSQYFEPFLRHVTEAANDAQSI